MILTILYGLLCLFNEVFIVDYIILAGTVWLDTLSIITILIWEMKKLRKE